MVKHLNVKFGGQFHWDGQQSQTSVNTRHEAELDDRMWAKQRSLERQQARTGKREQLESFLRAGFPRQGG